MICPKCQNECRDSDRYCFRCGAELTTPTGPRKGSHKVPLLILIALSVIGIVLYFAIPMTGVPNETPWFTVVDGVLYFDATYYSGSSELIVPESVNGQTVTALGSSCFRDCTNLTTVILPDTLRVIEENAFSDCTSMRGIFIPAGVEYIGVSAFSNCISLEAVSIPGSVTFIGSRCFYGCEKLFYILFDGEYAAWQALYGEHINIQTRIYCLDGTHL